MSSGQSSTYEPKHSLGYATKVGAQAAGVGAFVSAIQNALARHGQGASGILTRTGGTIGFFAAIGATFAMTEAVVANTREKDDPLNGIVGGCAAGFLAGIRARSLPAAVGSCAVLGATVGVFDFAGETLHGGTPAEQEERRKRFFKQKPNPPLTLSAEPTD